MITVIYWQGVMGINPAWQLKYKFIKPGHLLLNLKTINNFIQDNTMLCWFDINNVTFRRF